MTLSIKTIVFALLVGLLAVVTNADHNLRHHGGDVAPRRPRKLQAEESSGIYEIIHGTLDFAEAVTRLCTSSAVSDPAVQEFCDEAY